MLGSTPVIDAVIHPYNFDPANYANHYGEALVDMVKVLFYEGTPEGYRVPPERWARDWTVEEVSGVVFAESDTDLAALHVLPIFSFHDGCVSVEKALEVRERWPDRFVVYAGVDPMRENAVDELERQVELLEPVGLKLYPNSWKRDRIDGWLMDDPEVAFPVFERARELGLKVIAVHKALPMGPVELVHYKMDDIDRAAMAFPDLAFEVVHGGMAFVEETAWQIARFPNVYVNLETTTTLLGTKLPLFERALAGLLSVGGAGAVKKILWGTGCVAAHPQPLLDAFRTFEFSDQYLEGTGLPQLDDDARERILWRNYADMTGLDVPARLEAVNDDEFARAKADGFVAPWHSTAIAGQAV